MKVTEQSCSRLDFLHTLFTVWTGQPGVAVAVKEIRERGCIVW